VAAQQLAPRANWVRKTLRIMTRVEIHVVTRVVATVSSHSPVAVALGVD
jgi:hypothetical protein